MLRIVNLEEIENLLLRVSALADLQEQRDPDFVREAREWFARIEEALANNRMAVAGNVAALRGLLVSAERGAVPAGVELHGRATGRRIREAAAAHLLREAADLVSRTIAKDRERIAEAERLALQLVAIAKAKGLVRERPAGENLTDMLRALWRVISGDPELSAGAVTLEGLVGKNDALVILDRAITCDPAAQ